MELVLSMIGSRYRLTTVWAMRSATVGFPVVWFSPCPLVYRPDVQVVENSCPKDIQFQILKRLSFKSSSNSAMDCPSTRGAPLVRLNQFVSSHTSHFEIQNGLLLYSRTPPISGDLQYRPDQRSPLRSSSITEPSSLTTDCVRPVSRIGTLILVVSST